jgi:hypothetical protein
MKREAQDAMRLHLPRKDLDDGEGKIRGNSSLETERMCGVIQEPVSGEKKLIVENGRISQERQIEAADQCDDRADANQMRKSHQGIHIH